MSRKILAIDIRNEGIGAVLLNTGLKSTAVEAFAHIRHPGESQSEDGLSAALSDLLKQIERDGASVVVALPADQAIFRTLTLPFKEEKKIRQILPFELESSLPVPVDDLIIDFQKRAEGDGAEVLTAAMDRQHLDQLMSGLASVNMSPELVVPGGFPLALGLINYHDELPEHALLLDVDTHATTLFVFVSNRIALIRSLPADVSADGAEEALALKIRQTLTAFSGTKAVEFTPATLYISGPGLQDPTLGKRLGQALKLPVQSIDLVHMLPRIDPAETNGNWKAHILDSALSLALIEAEDRPCPNFHRSSSALRNYWTTYRPFIKTPVILLLVALLFGLGGILLDSHLLQRRVDDLNTQIEQVFRSTLPDVQLKGLPPLDYMKSKLIETRQSAVDPIGGVARARSIDILFQLSQLIPKDLDVILNRLVFSGEELTVSGDAAGFDTVDDIKSRLEKSELFKQVTITSANMDKSDNKIRFKLKIDL